jgi:hypothetical protein
VPERVANRWRSLTRGERAALVALAALTAGAIGVRLWFMAAYRPAFLGFEDSHEYVFAAAQDVFRDPQHPAGYPIFLGFLHLFSDSLSATILAQHVIGVLTGLVLYAAVRRTGAPRWVGLVPAAVAYFNGTGIFLEHSLLSDPLFAFLQALGLYAGVRALAGGWRWIVLAGLAVGASFWVKTVGLSGAVAIAIVLLAAPGALRLRFARAGAVLAVTALAAFAYVLVQDLATGYFGYERQSAWNLYGRVATFVDCSSFKPPAGTAFLCPSEPLSHRESQAFFQYSPASPAVARYKGPCCATAEANTVLKRFSTAAIEHEPVAYAKAIARGFGFYVFPRYGEVYDPDGLREALLDPAREQAIQPAIAAYYPTSVGFSGPLSDVEPLSEYEKNTRIEGALLVVLLAFAVIGPLFLRGRLRLGAYLMTLTALFSILFAIAGNGYDARYAYPTFAPLAAGAALGAWGFGTWVAALLRRRSGADRSDTALA